MVSSQQLTSLLDQARSAYAADAAVVLQLDPAAAYLDTYAAVGIDVTVRERVRIRVGDGFAGRVAAERRPVAIDVVTSDNVVNAALRAHGVQSLLGVPLELDGRLVGVLHVGSLEPHHFTGLAVEPLVALGAEVARELTEEIWGQDRAATLALQRSLLPARLPDLPGLDLAARYLHAEGVLGGDWYDVFALPGGRVGLVMGDVAGHGLPAAIVMGRLRSALRAYSLLYDDPAEVLHHLDAKIQHFEPGVFATVLYAVAEYPYERVQFSSAGHPAPLMVTADGTVTGVPVPPDLPMGAVRDHPRTTTTRELPPDAALVLFTDGLVERRPPGRYLTNLDRLMEAIEPLEAEKSCARIIDEMFRNSSVEDDTALLVVRRV